MTRHSKRNLYPLPDVINPPERLCVKINIPNEPGHRAAFLGAIYNLTRWYSWQRDDNETAKQVADVWFGVWAEMLEGFYDNDCEGTMPAYTLSVDGCNLRLLAGETVVSTIDLTSCAVPGPPGPPGADGESIVGPPGEPGADGQDGQDGRDAVGGPSNPPPPETDDICAAAHGLAAQTIAVMLDIVDSYESMTLGEFWNHIAQLVIAVDLARIRELVALLELDPLLWPDIRADIVAAQDDLVCVLYDNALSQAAAATWANNFTGSTTATGAIMREAVLSITPGQWALWAFVTSKADGTFDCGDCGDEECPTDIDAQYWLTAPIEMELIRSTAQSSETIFANIPQLAGTVGFTYWHRGMNSIQRGGLNHSTIYAAASMTTAGWYQITATNRPSMVWEVLSGTGVRYWSSVGAITALNNLGYALRSTTYNHNSVTNGTGTFSLVFGRWAQANPQSTLTAQVRFQLIVQKSVTPYPGC